MALQGTLDTFALPDVLHLLAATKKTGRLHLTSDRGAGSVWVDSGEPVAVVAEHAPLAVAPVDALFELLRFEHGDFAFEADERTDAAGPATSIDELIDGASALLAEWREIESVVPSLDAHVTLRRQLDGDVTISPDRWTTLVAVGSGSTVRAVGERLDLAELPVSRAVRELVELGVADIEVRAPEPEPVVEPVAVAASPPPAEPEVETTPVLAEPAAELVDPAPRELDDRLAAALERDEPAGEHDHTPDPAQSADRSEATGAPADALPTARPIRARRPRPRTLEVDAQPDHFVPLDLPGHMSPAVASAATAESEVDGQLDDLAAVFPGLGRRDVVLDAGAPEPLSSEAADEWAAGEPTLEEREASLSEALGDDAPIQRGLLLKFLGSGKS